MTTPGRLTRLLALAASLAGCASAPPAPVRQEPPRLRCAFPPTGAVAAPAPTRTGARPDVLVARARQLRAEGDHVGALARLEQAALAAPDDVETCFELADLLVADELDLDRAGAMLGAIPDGHPRLAGTIGRYAELRGDLGAAEAAYALQLGVADDPELRLRRALVLERLGRDAEAVAELERLRAADPAHALARAHLAERYEAAGRLGEAEAELRALAEASGGRPEGWRRLAAFCSRNSLSEKARAAEARAREAEAQPARVLRPLRPTGR